MYKQKCKKSSLGHPHVDIAIRNRHIEWGWECPCTDIDFIVIEYDYGEAVAIIEYKRWRGPSIDAKRDYNLRAQIDLAIKARIPMYAVKYTKTFLWFKVIPLNCYSREYLPKDTVMTEKDYIKFIIHLRRDYRDNRRQKVFGFGGVKE